MVYIDPKVPRPAGKKARIERARLVARQQAKEARRQKWRLLFHGVVMYLGVWAFRHTDVHSEDPFTGGTLVVLDMLFCFYLLAMLMIEIWRR